MRRLAAEHGLCPRPLIVEICHEGPACAWDYPSRLCCGAWILYALALAASQAARATVLLSEVEPRSPPLIPPDNMQGGVRTPREAALEDDSEATAALIQARAREQGVPCKLLISDARGSKVALSLRGTRVFATSSL